MKFKHASCKKQWSFFYLLACLFLFAASVQAACTVRDDAGNLITIQPARRIISLAPDVTEILFAIGAGKHIIGVMSGSDYPENAQNLPRIGSFAGLDIEKIISLKPDLIITWDVYLLVIY